MRLLRLQTHDSPLFHDTFVDAVGEWRLLVHDSLDVSDVILNACHD